MIQGEVTEETLLLRKELDEERATRRRVETEHASVSDEFKSYRETVEKPVPLPVKKKEKKPEPRPFRLGRFV